MPKQIAKLLKVIGIVQRVGYRRYLLDLAQKIGVAGYVKNEKDGSVTLYIQGEEDKVNTFLEEAYKPFYPAKVEKIELIKEKTPDPKIKYFEIKFGTIQEELQEEFGAMQAIFMNYWQEFRDYRQEFRDYRREFREFAKRTDQNFQEIKDKYGEISERLTEILDTLRRESKETREKLNESLKLLKEAIEKLDKKK